MATPARTLSQPLQGLTVVTLEQAVAAPFGNRGKTSGKLRFAGHVVVASN